MRLVEKSITKNVYELLEEEKLVDDKYIRKNIFNKNVADSVLDSYKTTLIYMYTIDGTDGSLEAYIGMGIHLFTLDKVNDYILSLMDKSDDFCKVRYNACKGLNRYVPAVKELKTHLYSRFMDRYIRDDMTEAQKMTVYQDIIKNKYNGKLPNNHLGEAALRDIAFKVWLETYDS